MVSRSVLLRIVSAVEINLSGLIGMVKYPDKQKIRIIGFLFENTLHWQFTVRLLLFTVCLNLSTAFHLKF